MPAGRVYSVSRSSELLDNQLLVGVFGQLKGGGHPTTGRVASINFVLFNKADATLLTQGRDIRLDQLELTNSY